MKQVVNLRNGRFTPAELQQLLTALIEQLELQIVYTDEANRFGVYEYKVEKKTAL